MDPKAYWVGFNYVKGIGAVRFKALLDFYSDAEVAWQAPYDGLKSAGLPVKVIEHFLQVRKGLNPEVVLEKILRQDIQVITWNDQKYPMRLKQIDQPPPVLYIKGDLLPQDEWAAAIVGTRRVTAYGRQVAGELGSFLAQHGVTVVSGLARGVDSIAHGAAVTAGGRTIAVLGSGVDQIYPPENRGLAEKIMHQGAVISDYPPGTPPDSANFPPRNRIISGLSPVTVVIEAGAESGALITATFAAEQGREVFALPGNIYAPQSIGTNRLIQQGARPLLNFEEILEVLNITRAPQQQALRLAIPSNEIEADLLAALGAEPVHIDELGLQSGLPISQVSATLTMMELKGMVRHVGGMNYILVRELPSHYDVE